MLNFHLEEINQKVEYVGYHSYLLKKYLFLRLFICSLEFGWKVDHLSMILIG